MDEITRNALMQREERLIREFSELPNDADEDRVTAKLEEIAVLQCLLYETY